MRRVIHEGVTVDALKALLIHDSAFTRTFGFQVQSIEPGVCSLLVPFNPLFERPGGIVSGQVYMTAADVAMWLAIKTRRGLDDSSVTVSMHTSFVQSAREEPITCTARVLRLALVCATAPPSASHKAASSSPTTPSRTCVPNPRPRRQTLPEAAPLSIRKELPHVLERSFLGGTRRRRAPRPSCDFPPRTGGRRRQTRYPLLRRLPLRHPPGPRRMGRGGVSDGARPRNRG